MLDRPDAVVGHVRLREPPEDAGLEVRGVEDEPRSVRAGPGASRRRGGGASTHSPADLRSFPGAALRARSAGTSTVRAARPRSGDTNAWSKPSGDAGAVEVEARPAVCERSGGDRPAGHARDAVELRQEAELVQPPERARVEEHRAVAAAGEAESNTGLEPSLGAVADVTDGARRASGSRVTRSWLVHGQPVSPPGVPLDHRDGAGARRRTLRC